MKGKKDVVTFMALYDSLVNSNSCDVDVVWSDILVKVHGVILKRLDDMSTSSILCKGSSMKR